MKDWRHHLLQHFQPALAAVSRLTVVSDPDELLLEEGVLDQLRASGFELIPFEDPVAFRFQYERQFRQLWDRGEATSLVVVLRTPQADASRLPYDLLQVARRDRRVLHFNIAELFPELVPAVVRSLDRRWFTPLWTAVRQHAPKALGEGKTCDFILRYVFEVTPEQVKSPSRLLHMLLHRHYRGLQAPERIDTYLIDRLREHPRWEGWPLEQIIPDRESFFTFLQERWSYFLRHKVSADKPLLGAPEEPYGLKIPGPVEIPFDHDDVRIYIDNLFAERRLRPIPAPAGLPAGWWTMGTLQADPREAEAQRLERLTRTLQEQAPGIEADRAAWLSFAPRFAEWLALQQRSESPLSPERRAVFEQLHSELEERFTAWMLTHYAALANLPYLPAPVMVHQIPLFLRHKLKAGAKRALVVVDGLALDQWVILRERMDSALLFDERAVFAWVPTLTSVSRQAIFAGQPPLFFEGSLKSTHKEKEHWQRLWADAGLAGPAVAHVVQGYGPTGDFIDQVRAAAGHPRCRAIGIVVNTVDRIMHSMELGSSGMHVMVQHWADKGELQTILELLLAGGFDVYLTADHGNVQAEGIGKPNVGVTAENRGSRVHIFDDSLLRDQLAAQTPGAIPWPGVGLPESYHALLAPKRQAFIKEGVTMVGHGGISIEEVIVPFIHIQRGA